ncbi:MAG TPA: hypothetical protein PKK10_00550 [Woeseiaceae bacterium]|nr:hypothetical protein [Woeseiaceae bacterium]
MKNSEKSWVIALHATKRREFGNVLVHESVYERTGERRQDLDADSMAGSERPGV